MTEAIHKLKRLAILKPDGALRSNGSGSLFTSGLKSPRNENKLRGVKTIKKGLSSFLMIGIDYHDLINQVSQ